MVEDKRLVWSAHGYVPFSTPTPTSRRGSRRRSYTIKTALKMDVRPRAEIGTATEAEYYLERGGGLL